jgi:hypothetical protein
MHEDETPMPNTLESRLTPAELALFRSLDTPEKIQAFLDSIPYSAEDVNRTPLEVLRDRKAHCLDGALFAVAALRRIGHAPQVADLLPEPGADDDHVLALFRRDGLIGCVAKSNFVGLRYREAIHRNIRELAISYFEDFYNVNGQKTLRAYTAPISLATFDALNWETERAGVDAFEKHLYRARRHPLLSPAAKLHLSPLDERSYKAGMLGTDPNGLYKPKA